MKKKSQQAKGVKRAPFSSVEIGAMNLGGKECSSVGI